MRLQAKYPNPDYDANKVGEDAAAKKARTKDLYLQPNENLPAVYLPPSSGGGILFERADVYLDGQDISKDVEVSNLQFVYQFYNRTFSNSSQRSKLGQEVNITCSEDVASLTKKSEKYKKAIQPLQNVTYSSATTLYLEFGLDGFPFLSAPRNHCLASLQKQTENDNPMLPPGKITFFKKTAQI